MLMSDGVAQRILDSEVKVSDPESALQLSELYGTLSRLDLERASDRPRHHRCCAATCSASTSRGSTAHCCDRRMTMPADARALQREQARRCAATSRPRRTAAASRRKRRRISPKRSHNSTRH